MAKIEGSINIVGDKSLSHRAVMLCSLANGISNIRNILISGDTKATINIFKQLGVEIKDKVKYAIPMGFLGRFIHAIYIKNDLKKIFAHRKTVIDDVFSG